MTLEVFFRNGGRYAYDKVPAAVFDGLLKAPSVGHYFDEHVKKAGFLFRKLS
jgi:hypothetical protein